MMAFLRRALPLALVVALSFVQVGCAPANAASVPFAAFTSKVQLHPNLKVVFVGDSIVVGGAQQPWYQPMTTAWAAFYGGSTPTIVNAGVSGNKVADILARLQADVIAQSPDIVWFEGGINDLIAGTDITAFAGTVATILSTTRVALPSAQMAWTGLFAYGEQYPDPGAATVNSYNDTLNTSCQAGRASFINVRPWQQAYEASHNLPGPGAITGVMCADVATNGIHPTTAVGVPAMSTPALARCVLNAS